MIRSLALVAVFSFAGSAVAADFKATCPVSNKPATEDSKVEKDGKKIYFCCDNCPKAYEKDSKKFAAKANYQLLETKQIKQTACPLTGGEVKDETKIKIGAGKVEVGFCCANCQAKVEKAKPAEQVNLVFKDIKKGFTAVKAAKE